MAKEKDRLFRVLKDGLTVGYTVCMTGDLVVNADNDPSTYHLIADQGGVHPTLGKCIEQVPMNTEPAEGCRMIGNIHGGKPVTKKQEAAELGMVNADGIPAERNTEPEAKKKTAKKKTARRR